MARLHTSGFDSGVVAYECSSVNGTPSASNVESRTGTYSCYLDDSDEIRYVTPAITELYIGYGLWIEAHPLSVQNVIEFIGNLGGTMFNVACLGTGQIVLRRGSTILATAVDDLSESDWFYIEVWYEAHNTTGDIEIRINGATLVSYNGDTINTADTTISEIRVHGFGSQDTYIDDLVINDTSGAYNNTWPGQPHLSIATVNGAGANADFTPSAGSNYQCVDEIPVNTTDYVSSSNATDLDTYAITDPLVGTETINNVIVNIVAKLDSGAGNIDIVIISNATQDNSAAKALNSAWERYQECWPLNPDDSAAWQPADIDDLEIGQEVS